jgi:hypothetical protein
MWNLRKMGPEPPSFSSIPTLMSRITDDNVVDADELRLHVVMADQIEIDSA